MFSRQSPFAFAALSLVLAACGDKLDPVIVDVATAPATDANQTPVATNSNTVTNPNAVVAVTPSAAGLCNTGATQITYALHAKKVLDASCSLSSCHNTASKRQGVATDTYAGAKSAFATQGAKDQIDSGQMPLGSPLSKDQLCILDTWATTGLTQ